MNAAALLRGLGVLLICGLLFAKLILFGPAKQTDTAALNANLAAMLTESGAGDIYQRRQPQRSDLRMIQFSLHECPEPYYALQALTLEDLQAMLDAAQPLPKGLTPHVLYLGHELAFDDRLGLKLTAVAEFARYRLGLSPEAPAGYLYVVLAAPKCSGYRNLGWEKVWAAE